MKNQRIIKPEIKCLKICELELKCLVCWMCETRILQIHSVYKHFKNLIGVGEYPVADSCREGSATSGCKTRTDDFFRMIECLCCALLSQPTQSILSARV